MIYTSYAIACAGAEAGAFTGAPPAECAIVMNRTTATRARLINAAQEEGWEVGLWSLCPSCATNVPAIGGVVSSDA